MPIKSLRYIFLAGQIFWFLLSEMTVINAQNTLIRSFSTKDGLAHNNVRAIVRDSTGFLWIGTWDGLSRFDGYEFKNYHHIPGDTTSIPYFSVYNLTVDGANNIWIITDSKQIARYDRARDNFIQFNKIRDKSTTITDNLCVDDSGNLWIINKDVLFRRDHFTGKINEFRIKTNSNENAELKGGGYLLSLSHGNRLWLTGTDVTEILIDGQDARIMNTYDIRGPLNDFRPDFELRRWSKYYESPDRNKWLISNTGLYKFNPLISRFEEFHETVYIQDFEGSRKIYWSDLNSGTLNIPDPGGRSIIKYAPEISNIKIAIYYESDNLIWYSEISAEGEPLGMKQLIRTPDYFKNFLFVDQQKNRAVFSILQNRDNEIYVGTQGNNYILKYSPDNKIEKKGILNEDLFRTSGHIRQMLETDGGFWVGYFSNLLMFYNPVENRFTRFYPDDFSFRTICLNFNGELFIGTNKLSLFNPATGETTIIWESPENAHFYDLLLTEDGTLWGGMGNSLLFRYNSLNEKKDLFRVSPELYHIEDICVDENGTIWLAMLGGGLCNFNPETEKTISYTTSNGLANNTTYSILKDRGGNLWISTDNGISRFNPATGQFRSFSQADGLKISEFNSDASFVSHDGEFLFGGMGGFVSFYPDSINMTEQSPPDWKIFISKLEVSGEKKFMQGDINSIDTLIFTKGENNFHISFSTTDFINQDKIFFRYKLSEIDNEWIETDFRNRNINYANLKPDWYRLSLEARDINGAWNTSKNFTIRISPYFYQTLLFRVIVPVLILSLIIFSIMNYISQLKKTERLKQDELKLQALRGQMNPHFIFNSLNSINYFISNNDRLSANRYIADFSTLIRTILANLEKNFIPFNTELESLNSYLKIEHLRFEDKFDFELNSSGIERKENLEVLPGLVQPFIENAIWHGVRALENRKGNIRIRFIEAGNNIIRCTIEDDGIGRKLSRERTGKGIYHKSRGIEIVAERLQIISKIKKTDFKMEISDLYPGRPETGTIVKLDIPVKLK